MNIFLSFIVIADDSDDDLASSPEIATPGLSIRGMICKEGGSVSSDLEGSPRSFARAKATTGIKNVTDCRKVTENVIPHGHNCDSDVDVDVVSLSTLSTHTSATDRHTRYSSLILINYASDVTVI